MLAFQTNHDFGLEMNVAILEIQIQYGGSTMTDNNRLR